MSEKFQNLSRTIQQRVRKNFRSATLNMLFVLAYVNGFQAIFGPENSIVGVIFVILMSASMARDLTATPIKHFLLQAGVLLLMAATACFVANMPPLLALPVNFAMLFLILYCYTYEYATHLYFPYILSYLFLLFISPVTPALLPKRLLAMLVGAICVILYQWFMGRNRVVHTARDCLTAILDETRACVSCLLTGQGVPDNPETLRENLCKLSRMVYERRKKVLCISDASFAMVDVGRGLENLILLLYSLEGPLSPEQQALFKRVSAHLDEFRAFVRQEIQTLSPVDGGPLEGEDPFTRELSRDLRYIRQHLLAMVMPEHQAHYRKTMLSLSLRAKAAMDVSPVRVAYALRVGVLLALCTLGVQLLALPHGKWLLFTVGSVSLPYADDMGLKAKKRLAATIIGGLAAVAAYALVPSPMGRTFIMMASGYISYYLADYTGTFACSTVGALGGAVFLSAFGWRATGELFGIRLGYVLLGIGVALLANCAVYPFRRQTATRQLWEKYAATSDLLAKICRQDQVDSQLYYHLVLQAHMQEEKLLQNARAAGWEGMKDRLAQCREAVRAAHRHGALSPQN